MTICSLSPSLFTECVFVSLFMLYAYMSKHTYKVNSASLHVYLLLFLIFLSSKSLLTSFLFPGNYEDSWANSHYIISEGTEEMKKTVLMCYSGSWCSVAQLCLTSCWPHGLQHARLPWVYLNSCPSSWWWHPAISPSVTPFSSCLQSFPASGSFPMSQLFAWGGQSIGVSASASVLPVNTQDCTQYRLINHKGKEYERECICIPGLLL